MILRGMPSLTLLLKSWSVPDTFCGLAHFNFYKGTKDPTREVLLLFRSYEWGGEMTCPATELGSNPAVWFQSVGSSSMLPALVHRYFWTLHSLISLYNRHRGYFSSDCILEGCCILCWNQIFKSTLGSKLLLKNFWSLTRHGTFSSHAGLHSLSIHLSVDYVFKQLCVSTFCLLRWMML